MNVEELAGLSPIVDSAAQALSLIFKYGTEKSASTKQVMRLKQCIRGALLRELLFNREVINELRRTKAGDVFPVWSGDGRARLVQAIRTDTFKALELGVLPLEEVLEGRALTEDLYVELFDPPGSNTPRLYVSRTQNINSRCELLSRAYHRIQMLKLYGDDSARRPDLGYLEWLIAKSILCLRQEIPGGSA